jgi:hypothetical protein
LLNEAVERMEQAPATSQQLAEQATHQLEQASGTLVLREQQLRQDRAFADAILKAIAAQQQAARELAAGRVQRGPVDRAALQRSVETFASEQAVIGRAVQEITGQSEIAERALREALERASHLATDPATGEPAPAMGHHFFPESPQFTAQLMTDAPLPSAKGQGANQPSARSETAPAGIAADHKLDDPTGYGSGEAKAGPTPTPSASASRPAQRTFAEEPWMVNLPAAARQAIDARARRPAPPGYEERLRRYFEAND